MEQPASPATRRPSFGSLLRRTKSGDLGKKAQAAREAELERQRQQQQRQRPPRLPDFASTGAAGQPLSKALTTQLRLDPTHFASNGPAAPYNGPNHFNGGRQDSSLGSISSTSRSYTNSAAPPPLPGAHYPVQPPPFDPYAATESMTHRGRYSYASSAISTINSPRRVRRRKDPTPFK